jgi:hypothetical protein
LLDLNRWRSSPFVRIDSIGLSVQSRTLFRVTIEDTSSALPRTRISIHTRTHPGEVQSTWVTNQIIEQLLAPTPLAYALRTNCVFNIVPMYNPDGVELGLARQNAHNIDIESNWTAIPGEPEVQALRHHFELLMAQPNPIRIALNMHSALDCKRYFVFHAAAGTTTGYAAAQQRFIGSVQAAFPNSIQPWNYYVSWTTAPSTVYPESWFWANHRDSVLALTYEDMNCTGARAFDSTATALLRGIADFLYVSTPMNVEEHPLAAIPHGFRLEQNYPNPFNPETTIGYRLMAVGRVHLRVYDVLGREVAALVDGEQSAGSKTVRWNAAGATSGIYFYRLDVTTANGTRFNETKRMVLLK